jgi:hypothetical protein
MIKKILLLIILLPLLFGCKLEKKYYWNREDGDKFILQFNIEGNKIKILSTYIPLAEKFKDLSGGTNIFEFYPCKIYDDENWSCVAFPGRESIEMVNGKLTWYYWSEIRKYKKRYEFNIY